jgi:hypothetical protein
VVDANGNTIPTNNSQVVTLSIYSGPKGARLEGTTKVRAVDGVATFTNLRLNVAGTYVLEATGGKLTPDFSNSFTIAPVDVTGDLKVQRDPVRRGRDGGKPDHDGDDDLLTQTITITNTSSQALQGPLALVLQGLPAGVSLLDSDGTYQGNQYVNILGDNRKLKSGQSITITLKFSVSGKPVDPDDLDLKINFLLGI